MRIAFLLDQFPALSETFMLYQITGMIERGHEVDIYSNYLGNIAQVHPEVESYNLLERCIHFQMPDNYLLRGLRALNCIAAKGWRKPAACLRSLNVFKYGKQAASLRLFYSASRFMGRPPYDIIHCQLGFLGLQGLLFRDLGALEGKLITSFRGSDFMLYLSMFGENYFDDLFARGDLFLPVCESMKRQMLELGCEEKKIVVHRSGLDFNSFVCTARRGRSDDRVRLVTLARLVESKGVEYGIRAVAKLAKHYRNLEYQIVGDGPLKEDLQRLIRELDLDGTVKLLGWKQRLEAIEILNQSDIMIAPSVTAKNKAQEGIPNVLKEAMVMGLPVISTQHGGIPELVIDGVSGFLVPEGDVDALAEKLAYTIEHPELWTQMSNAGRAIVEESYDLHKLNDRLVEIYQQLIASSSTTEAGSIKLGQS